MECGITWLESTLKVEAADVVLAEVSMFHKFHRLPVINL
jgi:hypothetical protein